MKLLSVILMSLMLISCAAPVVQDEADSKKYQEVLNLWLKKEKKDLISVWGNPSYDYQKDKINYVVYIKNKMKKVADGNVIERMPRMAREQSIFDEKTATVSKGCTTIFVIDEGYIRQWKFEGAECLAY
ncbi:MAG: hypothetical protein J6V53_04600 [Alphaproteobacteria bacterium]|nr:hypothetical protein [Alphaproteobacteria bacterium]